MFLHVGLQVGSGHVLRATDVADKALVIKVHGTNVARHVFVRLESGVAVRALEIPLYLVTPHVVLVETLLVESFVANVASKAAYIGVEDPVIPVSLNGFEAFAAVLANKLPFVRVNLHVSLQVVESRPLVVALVTLVPPRRPVLKHEVDVEADLLAEGLVAGAALVARLQRHCFRVDSTFLSTALASHALFADTFASV